MDHARGSWIPESLNPKGYQNLVDLLRDACRQYQDKPAFSGFGRTISFAELDQLSDAFAVYLQKDTDLEPGDRIAIQLPNLVQYPVVVFGALKAGLVIVNTNPLYTPREMAHQFKDSGAKALVIHASMAHNAEKILDQTRIKHLWVTQIGDMHGVFKRTLLNCAVKYLKKMEPEYHLPDAKPLLDAFHRYLGEEPALVPIKTSDLAALQYTGGTTGLSKGAMLTHGNLVSNVLQGHDLIRRAGQNWQQTTIAPLPLYHIYAFTISLVIMEEGGHSVLIANPRDIDGFVKELKHWQPTTFTGLNTLFVALCNHAGFSELDFSRLRVTISGGMPLTHAAAEQWPTITGGEILEGYGLTESSVVISTNPYEGTRKPGTIGQVVMQTEVLLLDKEDPSVLAAEGEPGELALHGPQIMQGYWNRPDAAKDVFVEHQGKTWLRTGDVATLDSDGFLEIVDRIKDMIAVGGFKVFPSQVEDVLLDHPAVKEALVIGRPDSYRGEAPVAYVTLNADAQATGEELRDWLNARVGKHERADEVVIRADLPKTMIGKLDRKALRAEVLG